ncbi:MAG: phosphatidylserine decarboxylase family protein [Elusimicrobia bacterium]|nr:phosphatidylserine decarboxylase family protein [Elusimicrobiota bacterium]
MGALGGMLVAWGHPAGWALAVLGLPAAAFCFYFFRDPERPLPADRGFVYSPGDGRVLTVAREGPGDVVTVRIFLSVFDVHVQRIPCSGVVEQALYQPGAFKMAMVEEARQNERTIVTIAVAGRKERVVVEQIAGYVARRIRCWLQPGQAVTAGERYGMIQFGSQAAVHLPASAEAVVKPGDRVVGGVTPLARWRSPA